MTQLNCHIIIEERLVQKIFSKNKHDKSSLQVNIYILFVLQDWYNKNRRLIFAQNFFRTNYEQCQSQQQKKLRIKKNKFQTSKETEFCTDSKQWHGILKIFQFLVYASKIVTIWRLHSAVYLCTFCIGQATWKVFICCLNWEKLLFRFSNFWCYNKSVYLNWLSILRQYEQFC